MNRVTHFEIQADNVERAKKFYEQAFGWKMNQAMNKDTGDMMDYWMIMTGDTSSPGINGGLYQRPLMGDDTHYLYDCTIEVKDIDKAIGAVKASGGTITREKSELPKVGWFASAKDTEGNSFGLVQAV